MCVHGDNISITHAHNIFNSDFAERTRLHNERIPEVEYSIYQHFRVSRRSGPSTIVDIILVLRMRIIYSIVILPNGYAYIMSGFPKSSTAYFSIFEFLEGLVRLL